jgi:cytochrome c-type biogenesis protein CcmH/NrfF
VADGPLWVGEEMTRFALLLLLVASSIAAVASDAASADPSQQQRIRRLEESLLAPCCWAEPVSVHRSEIALEMRLEIERFVAEGRTDREILDHYKGLHGTRILIEPEGLARWWVYFIPSLAAALGLALVVIIIRRLLRARPTDQPA